MISWFFKVYFFQFCKLWRYVADLAGSERVGRSEATGDRLKEAQHINKSLSALGGAVQAEFSCL